MVKSFAGRGGNGFDFTVRVETPNDPKLSHADSWRGLQRQRSGGSGDSG
jgi:hypothetical protein